MKVNRALLQHINILHSAESGIFVSFKRSLLTKYRPTESVWHFYVQNAKLLLHLERAEILIKNIPDTTHSIKIKSKEKTTTVTVTISLQNRI